MNSMADTYILASKARGKLTKAAARPDHDLRVLVAHANMLDGLMDKIHSHRESILDGSYISKNVSFSLPEVTHVKVVANDDDDSDSEEEEEDDESFYYKATQVDYEDDDDDLEYDSYSDDDDELTDDEDDDDEVSYIYGIERVSTKSFRQMPTIEESEQDLDEMSSDSEDEEDEVAANEDDEVDLSDLKRTPSLVYSTTEDSESEDEEEHEEIQSPSDEPTTHDFAVQKHQEILQDRPGTHGNLLLENLDEEQYTTPSVLCT